MSCAIGEEFLKHERLIERLVWKHVQRYGGDYDSLYSRAIDKMIVCYRIHDPSRQEWEKFLAVQIRYGLLDHMLEPRRKKHGCCNNIDDAFFDGLALYENASSRFIEELLYELTSDAQYIVESFVEQAEEYETRRQSLVALKARMREKGWSQRRIKAAFAELECVLTQHVNRRNGK
jgi:hypothetical protein